MSRLVVIRVGDTNSLWRFASSLGKWSSPESHTQVVRNLFVEGYKVYALFVTSGDIPISVAEITEVRERIPEEDNLLPSVSELGELNTIIIFNYRRRVDAWLLDFYGILNLIKYKRGSQISIPNDEAKQFISDLETHLVPLTSINQTIINPEYWINLNMHGY